MNLFFSFFIDLSCANLIALKIMEIFFHSNVHKIDYHEQQNGERA